ncbi:hypothetical protein [Streptomyces sp. NPDC088350]|uniref:hypothetical protein n=1 Tax=Streptomyces sp. NPDC088350 TaxID=3365854 RepID=UPI0037FA1EB1
MTIATGTLSTECVAPLEVALDKGEFKAEGLNVTLKVLPTPGHVAAAGQGGHRRDAGGSGLAQGRRQYKSDPSFVTYLAKLLKQAAYQAAGVSKGPP